MKKSINLTTLAMLTFGIYTLDANSRAIPVKKWGTPVNITVTNAGAVDGDVVITQQTSGGQGRPWLPRVTIGAVAPNTTATIAVYTPMDKNSQLRASQLYFSDPNDPASANRAVGFSGKNREGNMAVAITDGTQYIYNR